MIPDSQKWLIVFRFGGVVYTNWALGPDRHSVATAGRRIAQRRNVDIPAEHSELLALFHVGVDFYKGRLFDENLAWELVAFLKSRREEQGQPNPEDIDRNYPIMIQHYPVTQ